MQSGKNKYHIGHTMVTGIQSRDKLGDRRGQNDKMSTNLWEKFSSKRDIKKRKKIGKRVRVVEKANRDK